MKRSALLVLSSLLLTSSSYAVNSKCEDCYDLSTKNAAALHYTTSKPNSLETRYWDDYIHSGTKDITVYVRDLSRKDAQAALWFITTGGKHGFAAREATAQERTFLEDAIKHVAISYGNRSNAGRGLQEWSQVSNANHAGHLHLQMIYKQIDALNSKVNNLESEVKLLKAAQEKTDQKFASLSDTLIADSNARKEELKKLPALLAKNSQDIKTMMDKYEENWKTTLTAWTTNLDKERDEREKSRQERENFLKALSDEKTAYEKKLADSEKKLTDQKTEADKLLDAQKVKRRKYKKDLNDYKDQENKNKLDAKDEEVRKATEREKAAADALKQQQEEMRKEREAAAKEREAAAKEREMLLQRLAAFEASQANVQTGIGSNTANNNNSSSSSPFQERKQGMQQTRQYEVYTTVKATATAERSASQNG